MRCEIQFLAFLGVLSGLGGKTAHCDISACSAVKSLQRSFEQRDRDQNSPTAEFAESAEAIKETRPTPPGIVPFCVLGVLGGKALTAFF